MHDVHTHTTWVYACTWVLHDDELVTQGATCYLGNLTRSGVLHCACGVHAGAVCTKEGTHLDVGLIIGVYCDDLTMTLVIRCDVEHQSPSLVGEGVGTFKF